MPTILQIAVSTPLYTHFDYLPPMGMTDIEQLQPGVRLHVPFGRTVKIGILLAVVEYSSVPPEKLKSALELIDKKPIFPIDTFNLLQWASHYYHYPIGEVMTTALPILLRQGAPARVKTPLDADWRVTVTGQLIELSTLQKKKQKQALLLELLRENLAGMSESAIALEFPKPRILLKKLQEQGWITQTTLDTPITLPTFELNDAQLSVINQVSVHLTEFYPCLLNGVTGSGKTEVYIRIIQAVLAQNRQALILVPEINLTPQMVSRFKERFSVPIVVLHSKVSEQEQLYAWLSARDGHAAIVIGTRLAVWTPLARPGVFIVDEEHDPSYKQQDHFHYSARDIAVIRAKQAKVPILLGSATPSLESLYNVKQQRYQHLILPERTGTAVHPSFHVVDMRNQPRHLNISLPLKKAINHCLAQKQQVLLFLNRRGYAPTLMCYQCGWVACCEHCTANLTYHDHSRRLCCHHCGKNRPVDTLCPACQKADLHLLGQGTERIEEQLTRLFPTANIARVDSDSTQRKQAMYELLAKIHAGDVDILVGTQMLAKGHHFPKVTLVGVINIDGGLFGADFRSSERMAQLLMQVAGRAGRADDPGQVIIQTYHPEHALFTRLLGEGYMTFAESALIERQQTSFPPYRRLALLRAEAIDKQAAFDFLHLAKTQAQQFTEQTVELWGPVTAPMERRSGRYRVQLLLQAEQRDTLHRLLQQWLPTLPPSTPKVRWSLDVDPQDLL